MYLGGGGVAGSIAIPVVSEVKIKLQYCYTVTHSCAMVSYNQWQIEGAEPPPPRSTAKKMLRYIACNSGLKWLYSLVNYFKRIFEHIFMNPQLI